MEIVTGAQVGDLAVLELTEVTLPLLRPSVGSARPHLPERPPFPARATSTAPAGQGKHGVCSGAICEQCPAALSSR